MRDQYAGDVSDFLKFALLRALCDTGRTLGVGWYYNPRHDGRKDGRHREYCHEPKWKSLDPILLGALSGLPEQSVNALEKLPIWPTGTRFHHVPVPSTVNRDSWANNMKAALHGTSIVFLDPDNGVGKVSERHVTVGEMATMGQEGRTIVLIKFPERKTHAEQIERYHDLLQAATGAVSVITMRTAVCVKTIGKNSVAQYVPRARWFTLLNADDALIERAAEFARALNGIEKCKANVVHRRTIGNVGVGFGLPVGSPPPTAGSVSSGMPAPIIGKARRPSANPLSPERELSQTGNECPECGHKFKGKGFDGVDAHWRSKHERIMPYTEAWPLIRSGSYRREA